MVTILVTFVIGFMVYRWMPSGNTKSTKTENVIIAPVGRWSTKIPTLHGEVIRPHGPILLQNDKFDVVKLDNVDSNTTMAPIMQTAWVRVQSRTSQTVNVTVSK